MSEEIKEILDKLKNENNYQVDCNDGSAFKELYANEIYLLLDYITNLQEEKKQLKDGWQQEVYDKNEMLNRWYETQGRIDKAIEYIGNGNIGIPRKTRNKFINILQGDDKK